MQEVPRYDHQQMRPQFPDQEHLKCPRCDSDNTKFCYYNNYNLSQPRHYCKSCRRYWTKGGTLRNIPVGGGSRKLTKRSPASSTKRYSSSSTQKTEQAGTYSALLPAPGIDVGGSYSSLLTSPTVAQFGSFLEGLNPAELQMGEVREDPNSITEACLGKPEVVELNQSRDHDESVNYLGVNGAGGEDDSLSCWDSGNGWPDLAINTPAQILSTRNKWEHVLRRSSIVGEKEVALQFTGFLGLDGGFRAVNIAEEEEDEGGFWLLAGFIRAGHPMASVLSADTAVVSRGAVSSSHLPDLVLFVNPQCLLIPNVFSSPYEEEPVVI